MPKSADIGYKSEHETSPTPHYPINAVTVLSGRADMANIYQAALEEKFTSIMEVVARQHDYTDGLIGLTAECRFSVQNLAEQAIVEWTVKRQNSPIPPTPITNLQHLLQEYCAIADHL